MLISEIIAKVKQYHQPYQERENTRDKVLAGNPDQECTGIVVTVCATYEVLEKAKALGCNLIISHESIFFGGRIPKKDIENNEVYLAKEKYINDNNLCIWRDHDHMHNSGGFFGGKYILRKQNDFIFWGIMKELGWQEYILDDPMKPTLYKIPETTAKELAQCLMKKFNLNGLRVVGNPEAKVSKVFFTEHVNGNEKDAEIITKATEFDAMIPLEICDYTLTQYVRDAGYLGKDKVILEMGHFNCEEIGMKYMKEWLPKALGTEDIDIHYVQAGDTFTYLLNE